MRLKDVRIVWLFLAILAASAVCGLAQWRRPDTWSSPSLNLTDDQLAKIQEIRLAFHERIMPLLIQCGKAQLALDSLTMKGAAQNELEAARKTLDGIEAGIEKAYQNHWSELRSLLNEEQRVLFDRYGGLGMGLGWGANSEWAVRRGWGRGFGLGYGLGMRPGYRHGWGPGMRPGYGGGRGRGLGRGYFCPWFRWR